jgi:hypothetical protein
VGYTAPCRATQCPEQPNIMRDLIIKDVFLLLFKATPGPCRAGLHLSVAAQSDRRQTHQPSGTQFRPSQLQFRPSETRYHASPAETVHASPAGTVHLSPVGTA